MFLLLSGADTGSRRSMGWTKWGPLDLLKISRDLGLLDGLI